MAKTFRSWDVDQIWLLPPSVQELVPLGHVAHFVRETVRESLDLSSILETYAEERGYPPYQPTMMTALLLYGYTQGIYSSRRIARSCEERVDFMAVTALQKPDFRTISEFRRRHLKALGALFVQILKLCRQSGLVKLGHVALDGTKIRANASKHKAMSYARMQKAEQELASEVDAWFKKADALDTQEDAEFGPDQRGDELPAWVVNKQQRLAKIRAAKQALEAEAKEALEAAKREDPPPSDSEKPRRGRPRKPPTGVPKPEAQRNFSDPESRIMNTREGFQQCYNAQAAVDADSQVIVACDVTQSASDRNQLKPMVEQIEAHNGRNPTELSADAGYCSEENLAELERREIRGYVAIGKQRHGKPAPAGTRNSKGERTQRMKRRLQSGGYRSRYRLRKQTAEPVFGQVKSARGFRQVLLRGVEKVTDEWSLVCTAHNLLKLAHAAV